MELEEIRKYCLSKKGATEDLPFDDKTLVFKVGGKMFALLDLEKKRGINLKCNSEKAIEIRERYHFVVPGYHMSKKHWNTVMFDAELKTKQLYEWIDDSYDLVFSSLTQKEKLLV
ncbi:MAG TPA: MmcQ-like protein [Bacteroidales bacterium]|nr:MAG: MmcQ-like protein [Bacteroidetes bacterium GWF2_33_38]OFY74768.1 MAG: MmcQ-like protein [Bacteroidetes bacterium RIFOXYA12_FULL_33_9]OFY91207.1 MAG: MmcQ-like protein [Bacteroidetes bacterium RIFOXYA2_FULL_33_7]HBF87101.1 MmcQ-like protein [Bacteroidales bacterium]